MPQEKPRLTLSETVEALRKLGRVELASVLKRCGNWTLDKYANDLWRPRADHADLEVPFVSVLRQHLADLAVDRDEASQHLQSLSRTLVMQTSTHLTASEGPTFHAIHDLAVQGTPRGETYWVAAYSATPFSNNAWPGSINYGPMHELRHVLQRSCPMFDDFERTQRDRSRDGGGFRLPFIPTHWRDDLLSGAPIPRRLHELWPHIIEPIRRLAHDPQPGISLSNWICQFCRSQAQLLWPDRRVIYIDINEVVRQYLSEVFQDAEHPISRMHFDPHAAPLVEAGLGDTSWFVTRAPDRHGRWRMIVLRRREKELIGPGVRIPLERDVLLAGLHNRQLIPALAPVFAVIAAQNGITCLGSLSQIEYLADFRQRWVQWNMFHRESIDRLRTDGLSYARHYTPEGHPVHALDRILQPQLPIRRHATLFDSIAPAATRMITKYS